MKKSHKSEKVNSAIKKALSEIFIYDLPIKDNMITVVRVETSPDLSKSDVYITALNDAEKVAQELNSKSGYIGHLLGNRIKIRKIPQLKFIPIPHTV
ncbi:30S ribosome-binding factor RbfA [Persephonella atlantica]|uniref:30S ribosome-binding factor RbfA n=1 Tax=Persephonella atlantica TaxID=2699429 RepID=A0ABS1GID2_9AQUI|nr:30S ribosome-binding factor RbfA [Persephonella atlantica]MBK3332703.1 30S ribosome-binding factor RbfA [Persephonella atlantica]